MAVNLKPFFDTNTLSPQSVASVERIGEAVTVTYGKRHAKVDALRLEIEILLDTLTNQVEAERAYHQRVGLFNSMKGVDSYGSTTAPECRPANRQYILGGLQHIEPRTLVKGSPAFPSSVPSVTAGLSKALIMLGEVDKNLRLYSHRVRFSRLQIQVKLLALGELMQENKNSSPTTAGR